MTATKAPKKTGAAPNAGAVLSAQEKAALRETIRERKEEAKRGANREAGEKTLLDNIAAMPTPDRVMAERLHAIVTKNAPELMPKTWYGMPAWANKDGKVVCFFKAASKFDQRYATFGFEENAVLDDGSMWATSWALTKLTAEDEKKIAALVKKAVS
jgi:uncharacterized protein YdhG (YjbR/CyaY superfamily)